MYYAYTVKNFVFLVGRKLLSKEMLLKIMPFQAIIVDDKGMRLFLKQGYSQLIKYEHKFLAVMFLAFFSSSLYVCHILYF